VYDGETGEVFVIQTRITSLTILFYNFSYPAHWLYGHGTAYKNIGTILKDVNFRKGIMMKAGTKQRIPVERYFESGDELLVWGRDKAHFNNRRPIAVILITILVMITVIKKIWAV